jgi:hypothetical protein
MNDPEKQQICDLRSFSSLPAAAPANVTVGRPACHCAGQADGRQGLIRLDDSVSAAPHGIIVSSTFQLLNFSTLQLFNPSTFQPFNFSTF